MKICLTQMGYPGFRGGGNTVVHKLSESLVRGGHNVTVVYIAPKHLASTKPETSYRSIIKKESRLPLFNVFKAAIGIIESSKECPNDIIFSIGYEGFLAPLIKCRAVFIAASHNFLPSYVGFRMFFRLKWLNPKNWGKLLYFFSVLLNKLTKRSADFIQTPSNFGKEQCVNIFSVPENKIFVVPNGVDLKQFPYFGPSKDKNILFLGGSSEHKGLDILIRALPPVIEKHPEVKVLVLGEMKSEENSLVRLAKDLNVFSGMDWLGLVNQEKIPTFFKRSFLSVLPSRLDIFGMVVLESMASGIPVIAADVGGVKEVIKGSGAGILIDPENPGKLAESIIYLLDNPDKAREMGVRGRRLIEEKFSWEKISEKFEKEFLSILNKDNHPTLARCNKESEKL